MVRRIDFLGAPGIGKTTLYKALLKGKLPANFISEKDAGRRALENYVKRQPLDKRLSFRVLHAIPKLRKYYASNMEYECQRQVHREFMKHHEAFYRAAADCLSEAGRSVGRMAGGFHSFIKKNMRWSVIHKHFNDQNTMILSDESLSHRIFLLLPWAEKSVDMAALYYWHLPAPDGLVYVTSDADTVQARIIERKEIARKFIPGHKNLDESELKARIEGTLELARVGASVLEDRGVPVLKLNGGDAVQSNVLKIQTYIGNFSFES